MLPYSVEIGVGKDGRAAVEESLSPDVSHHSTLTYLTVIDSRPRRSTLISKARLASIPFRGLPHPAESRVCIFVLSWFIVLNFDR